ncbi:DUF4302 domain-containing protein [Marinifilum flexuosum]|uniref:DUF4302 domain-containing protein n=1 Tax=Marinifilum flexuosum TaxID=1117708 RepID=UPI002495A29D|nr:DUF4302 domain-containing protein [Marinifilum flexuosum]
MKKNIYLVLFGLLLGIGTVSCDNESEDLFEQTAAERKSEAIKEYEDALKSAEKGWLFQYFPEENQKYGGYNYVVKFKEKDSVKVWMEGMVDSETSMFDVVAYGGPVLTFNTYNSLMHKYATPSAAEYNAKGGDFEFLLMSKDDDVITLKGVKTQNNLRLIKMTETPDEYFAKTKAVMDFLVGASMGTAIKKTPVTVIPGNRVLTFNYNDGKENVSKDVAFLPTDKGIHFYEAIEINGVSAQDFTLNKETKQLTSENKNMTINIAFAPVDLTKERWSINFTEKTDRSDAVKAVWDIVYAANKKTYNEDLHNKLFLGLCYAKSGDIGTSFYSVTSGGKSYRAHYNLSFGGVVGHDDYLKIIKLSGGFNWKWYGHLKSMVNMISDNAPYKTEVDDAKDPKVVKLTSVANPDVWFVLRK